VPASDNERTNITAASTRKKRRMAQRSEAMTRVDIAPLRRKQQCAADGEHALDGHPDRNDRLAVSIDPHHRLSGRARPLDLGWDLALPHPGLVTRALDGDKPVGLTAFPHALDRVVSSAPASADSGRRMTPREESAPSRAATARPDRKCRRPSLRRRDQPAQHGADPFGID